MSDTTTIDTPPSKDVSRSEITSVVAAAHPDLIEAMERAAEGFYRHEDAWQDEITQQQRAAGMPEESLISPYGKALKEASQAVVAKFEELHAAKNQEEQGT